MNSVSAIGSLFGLLRASSEVQPLVDAIGIVECLVTAVFEVLGMGPFV